MRRLAILPLLLLTGLCAAPAAHSAAPKDRCLGHGRTTVRVTKDVRLISPKASTNVFVCHRRTGRTTTAWHDGGMYSVGRVLAIGGRYVAYTTDVMPGCPQHCPPYTVGQYTTAVLDAATGRRRVLTTSILTAVHLLSDGTVAYLLTQALPYELVVWDAAGRRSLDTGDIAPGSVKLTTTSVSWTNAGTAKTASVG